MSADFSSDQKRYLEGFVSGVHAGRLAGGAKPTSAPAGPDAAHIKAQDAIVANGGKLADQEKWKKTEHPFDAYGRFKDQAARNEYPKPDDNFRWRYFGLFYVAPTQNSYMCRLRIPNGVLTHWQMSGLADIAETKAGGYAHVTTRANLQIREIEASDAPDVLERIIDLGLCSRGSGADNIRNVTGSATAGIDPHEIADTRPLARAWHHHILNSRELYGLPRKFNVAFDGGGAISTLEDTNDIGFQAIAMKPGAVAGAGQLWRILLGGITGHKDMARASGAFCRSEECNAVAEAMIRVFIAHGDRTNRARARLKYVLDDWGFDRFIRETEALLGRSLTRIQEDTIEPRPAINRSAHIGVHAQKQRGLNWVGVVLPVGRMSVAQMRALARIAASRGDGDLRLTVWQNLLISGVRDKDVETVLQELEKEGLGASATSLRAGLVACTGATGCKFGAAHTKEDALAIADYLDSRIAMDQPVNIHLTGCHHSCAQHYIGDIGLIGAKVQVSEDGDTVPGYDVVLGGGYGDKAQIGRVALKGVKASEAPRVVEALLGAFKAQRLDKDESFQSFAQRLDDAAIARILNMAESVA